MNYAKATLAGNITKSLELRTISSGTKVLDFSIAVNRRVKGEESVSYFDLTAFGKTAEMIAQYFGKGRCIFVECRPEQQTWDKDGQRRSAVKFIVDGFQFTDSKGGDQHQDRPAPKADKGNPIEPDIQRDSDIPF